MNRDLAIHVVQELLRFGVAEFIVCPGARNSPFANLISGSSLSYFYCFEERSAAFYALGRARNFNHPVAVITTSGTAAAELLPALMEAYYTAVPLVAITADRPRRFRGTNAPQTAHQEGLYTIYTTSCYDIEGDERPTFEGWNLRTPLHINVCFEEPERDETPYLFQANHKKARVSFSSPPFTLERFLEVSKAPLVLVGALHPKDQEATVDFLISLNAPVYAEATSGLREEPSLAHLRIVDPWLDQHDGILRIGGVPTHRIWRDLEKRKDEIEVLSITEYPFSGSCLGKLIHTDLTGFFEGVKGKIASYPIDNTYMERQSTLSQQLYALLKEEPQAEPALIYSLSLQWQETHRIFLGNSLPIRYWDLAATQEKSFRDVWASRGLSGIDGQLSCFFGLCKQDTLNVALIGDLTALYDFASGWFLKRDPALNFALLILNNGGGKIFAEKFSNPDIQNSHSFQFAPFADFWKIPYQRWDEIPASPHFQGLIELIPDLNATMRFQQKWGELKENARKEVLRV